MSPSAQIVPIKPVRAAPNGMVDLHCHILPGIDDGAADLETSLAMAKIAVEDGIGTIACTPHIYPGLYENTAKGIRAAIASLQSEFDQRSIPLRLVEGADVHLDPDLVTGIANGRVPTLAGSRYLLLEPPHHVAPPRFQDSVFKLMVAGHVPIITHPERLTWIEDHYADFEQLVEMGAWMQITSGSLTGRFGRGPKYWAEKMLEDGLVHILATDSHHFEVRPPLLQEGRDAAAKRVGREEAQRMVVTRPQGIVDNLAAAELLADFPAPPAKKEPRGFWKSLFG
jgi:protein-tyrosine phosphatase